LTKTISKKEGEKMEKKYELVTAHFTGGYNSVIPNAAVEITIDGMPVKAASHGEGTVDAVFTAIKEASQEDCILKVYSGPNTLGGSNVDATVEVLLECGNIRAVGKGTDKDTVIASALAYIDALNDLDQIRNLKKTETMRAKDPDYPITPDGQANLAS
jgi:2-isopropylmalate synthase